MRHVIQNIVLPAVLFAFGFVSASASAHCDTMSGPVVMDARKAIEAGRPDAVFKWLRPEDEQAVREQFEKTLAVRRLSETAAELADRYFFETVVRLHRLSEGAPYTGLKEGPVEPIVEKSDQAIAEDRIDPLINDIQHGVDVGIRERFLELKAREQHKDQNVDAGREYVRAYVEFVHYVERLHTALTDEANADANSVSAAHQEHNH